jgi:hypothetical protein
MLRNSQGCFLRSSEAVASCSQGIYGSELGRGTAVVVKDSNTLYFQVLTAASMKFRFAFWHVLPCKIIVDRRVALMMVAARTSETSVDNYFTRQYIPGDYTERKWEAQLEWSQVYRQEPRRLEKICRQPMFLMKLRTLLLHPRRQIWTEHLVVWTRWIFYNQIFNWWSTSVYFFTCSTTLITAGLNSLVVVQLISVMNEYLYFFSKIEWCYHT